MEYKLKTPQQLPLLLKAFKKEKGITQEKLGNKLDISQRSYAQFEANPERASFLRVFKALQALDKEIIIRDKDTDETQSLKAIHEKPQW